MEGSVHVAADDDLPTCSLVRRELVSDVLEEFVVGRIGGVDIGGDDTCVGEYDDTAAVGGDIVEGVGMSSELWMRVTTSCSLFGFGGAGMMV